VLHFLVGCFFGAFGLYGIIAVFFLFLGMELTQAMYRSFRDGYRWVDLYRRPWVVVKYLPARRGGLFDTLLDLALPVAGALLVWRAIQWVSQ